jgi:Na+-driven multidrug efflux pump
VFTESVGFDLSKVIDTLFGTLLGFIVGRSSLAARTSGHKKRVEAKIAPAIITNPVTFIQLVFFILLTLPLKQLHQLAYPVV